MAIISVIPSVNIVAQTNEELRQEIEELKRQQQLLMNNARQQSVWKSSSPFIVTWGSQKLEDKSTGVKYKSNLSIGLSKRHTYELHRKPIGGKLMIGIDVTWTDITFSRYEKGKGLSLNGIVSSLSGNVANGTYSNFDDYFNQAYSSAQSPEEHEDFNAAINRLDIGKYQIDASVIGVGPSVRVAPFYPSDKSWLEKIKVGGYFHYVPTMTTLLFTGNDETLVCGGYVGRWRYGVNLSFGRFGIGFEHTWGSGKLKKWKVDSDDEDSTEDRLNIHDESNEYSSSGTRIYIGLKF